MANHEINKKYSETLRKIEINDPVHPDIVNPLYGQLINNDAFLKDEVDSKETPSGAQQKADNAEDNAKQYADQAAQTAENNAKQYTDEQISLVTESAVPSGVITMWSGSLTSIPTGWALCDGQNGTPDLRDRFIGGAGGEYNIGDTGGEKEVVVATSQMPSHSHGRGTLSTSSAGSHSHGSGTLSTSTTGSHTHSYTTLAAADIRQGDSSSYIAVGRTVTNLNTSSSGSHSHSISGSTSSAGSHSHSINGSTGSTGGGEAHENRPPYFALAFIMKL